MTKAVTTRSTPSPTTPPAAGSTSTSAAAPEAGAPGKTIVRRKVPDLQAIPLRTAEDVPLPDGRVWHGLPGDVRLVHNGLVVEVAPGARFAADYELARPAVLSLDAAACAELERTLGLGATRSPEACLAAVARLATIAVGEVRIDFTPGQLGELQHRAGKRGHTLQEELQAVVDRVADEIFHHGPGYGSPAPIAPPEPAPV
jgi:hypothetical protein